MPLLPIFFRRTVLRLTAKSAIAFLAFVFAIPAFSQEEEPNQIAGARLSIAALTTYQPQHPGTSSDKTWNTKSAAVLFELKTNELVSFETGLLVIDQQYQTSNANYSLFQSVHRLRVPVGIKISYKDIISLGLGTYIAAPIEGLNTTKVIKTTDSNNLQTPAENFLEFGFDSSLSINLPINSQWILFIEGRYFSPYDKNSEMAVNTFYGLVGARYVLH